MGRGLIPRRMDTDWSYRTATATPAGLCGQPLALAASLGPIGLCRHGLRFRFPTTPAAPGCRSEQTGAERAFDQGRNVDPQASARALRRRLIPLPGRRDLTVLNRSPFAKFAMMGGPRRGESS